MQKIFAKAALRGVQNPPIPAQHTIFQQQQPQMQQQLYQAPTQPRSILRNSTTVQTPQTITNPSVHLASIQEPLEEIHVDDLHDTIATMMETQAPTQAPADPPPAAANTQNSTNPNSDNVTPYINDLYYYFKKIFYVSILFKQIRVVSCHGCQVGSGFLH